MISNPLYLGDGAYVHSDERGVVPTTGNHDPRVADNTIVLEAECTLCLLRWLDRHHPELFGSLLTAKLDAANKRWIESCQTNADLATKQVDLLIENEELKRRVMALEVKP